MNIAEKADGLCKNVPFHKAVVSTGSLASIALLEDLSSADLTNIASLCQGWRYAPRTEIISYMDATTDVYFLVSGKVQVTMFSWSGRVITFQDLESGDTFGEIAAIDGKPRTASIRTVTESFVVQMSAGTFLDLVWKYPTVGIRILARLTTLVRFLCGRVIEFHALSVAQRIHAELLRLATGHIPDGNSVQLNPAPTHADIASRAGTRREAVTREINVMARDGLVSRKNGALIIDDLAALTHLVDASLGSH